MTTRRPERKSLDRYLATMLHCGNTRPNRRPNGPVSGPPACPRVINFPCDG